MASTPVYAFPYPVPTDPADVPADVQALAARIEAVLSAAPTWTNILSFAAGWTNLDPAANPCSYYKDLLGVVRMRGLIVPGTFGTAIQTLPAGFRPPVGMWYQVVANGNVPTQVNINPDGTIVVWGSATAWVALSGIEFRIA